jgi:hypothetical protein
MRHSRIRSKLYFMAIVRLYNNGDYIFDKDKVNNFIIRIDNLIQSLNMEDIDTTELNNLKQLINLAKCYDSKNIWYVEQTEDALEQHLNNLRDLPF